MPLTNDQILARCGAVIRDLDVENERLKKHLSDNARTQEIHAVVKSAAAAGPVSADALVDLVNVRRAGHAIGNYGADSPMARANAHAAAEQVRIRKQMTDDDARLAKASEAPAPAPTRAEIIAEQARQREIKGGPRWA